METKKKSNEEIAKGYGLSRQTYENRLKTWVKVEINGAMHLVNPKQMMKL